MHQAAGKIKTFFQCVLLHYRCVALHPEMTDRQTDSLSVCHLWTKHNVSLGQGFMCVYERVVDESAKNGRKKRRRSRSDAEPKLVDDFPTEVKDWLFRRVRLNSDITGIIRLQPLYLSVPLP